MCVVGGGGDKGAMCILLAAGSNRGDINHT